MKQVPAAFGVFLLAAAVSASVKAQQNTPLPPQDAATEEERAKDAVDLDQVIVTGVRAPKAVDRIPGAVSLVSTRTSAWTAKLREKVINSRHTAGKRRNTGSTQAGRNG